jgi:serine/threonine protein kinase
MDKPSGWTWQSKLSAILVQVLTGLSKLDNMHIIHADIKPDKLMLGGMGKVKHIELGCALHASQAGINSYIQTRLYRAPEILLGKTQAGNIFCLWGLS